jgi:hypothetical protein
MNYFLLPRHYSGREPKASPYKGCSDLSLHSRLDFSLR